MEPTPTSETNDNQIDIVWIVANIFGIIALLEDKFGAEAVESIVQAATAIEDAMRRENEDKQ